MSNTEWTEARKRLEAHLQSKPKPTIAELEEILASEDNEPILTEPDGSLSVGHTYAGDVRAALDEVDRLTNAEFVYEHECEGCGLGETVVVDRVDVTEKTPPAVEDRTVYTRGAESGDEKVNVAEITAWNKVAVQSNKAVDAYLREIYPALEEHYGMPVDGIRRAVNAVTQDLREALRSTIGSLRSLDHQKLALQRLALHLGDKYSYLLTANDVPPSQKNVERKCREGHTYVTDANEPGKCWCGAPAELKPA